MTADQTTLPPLPDTPFWRAFQARSEGVLTWDRFDQLWNTLADSDGPWFVTDLDSGLLPDAPADTAHFTGVLADALEMYIPVRARSFCGAVFVDDFDRPGFVKIFDPYRMGASCGSSATRILPRWVLSRIAPDVLPAPAAPEPAPRPGFLARLSGRA